MKKQWLQRLLSTVLLPMVIVLTACTPMSAPAGPTPAEPADTRTIVDCDGRTVEIPVGDLKIACLYAYAGHSMTLLDTQDQIVALVEGLKRDQLMQLKRPDIGSLSVPSATGVINVEELIASGAELALIRHSIALSGAETEKMDKAGIPYIVIDYTNIEEQKRSIEVLGEVLNRQEAAQAYLDFYEDTIGWAQSRISDIPAEERVRIYHAVNEATRTDAKGSIQAEITALAGLINVSAEAGAALSDEKTFVTLEEIYGWRPEAIIANEHLVTSYILTDAKWQGLEAVQSGQVFTLPVGISRWGHPGSIETPMAVLYLAQYFYPEKFEDLDMVQFTADYYKTFFGLDFTPEEIEEILSGVGMRAAKTS
ncbi:ABC transporter substrate-binding protein [Acidaminobacter hydrogenoformans]|uniref:Iron complex transport system substrate-binding protein n=1 Tax=Acidaminobacter hydrogenoformans DSM 2784 TaxID=1120920 RepID=A0A1G5S678_9FIRM|nr:ABC transporter substrate-binding protein [Acidaminobacter hydrogenoformans]SCZ81826.1 iron complex transport system substrate-binding protein [Acidaminobacter hydrogenoformans DSM 2784]